MVGAMASVASDVFTPHLRALKQLPDAVSERAAVEGCAILAAAGCPVESLGDRRVRVPHDVTIELLNNALALTGDPAFALRAGAATRRGDFGLYDLLILSAPTFGESLRLGARYIPLLHDGVVIDISVQGDQTQWRYGFVDGVARSAAIDEYVISAFHVGACNGLGFSAPPTEVHFRHPRPAHGSAYEELFKAPVHFDRPHTAIVVPTAAFALPMATADAALLETLVHHAELELARIPKTRPFSRRVCDVLQRDLVDAADLAHVVRAMHLSRSTLQRRLQAEGTSHTQLLDEVRCDRALVLLADSQLNLGEVAHQLGFAHRSAFYRAFKRWHGVSPKDFRHRQAGPPAAAFFERVNKAPAAELPAA